MEKVRRTRRSWSDEEKCRIVAKTYAPGVSVSEVARRYDVNANLLFTWRRDPRFGGERSEACFLPVELEPSPSLDLACAATDEEPVGMPSDWFAPPGTELHLDGGVRLRFSDSVSGECLVRIVTALRRAS